MNFAQAVLAIFFLLAGLAPAQAEHHRLLVLDLGRGPNNRGAAKQRLILFDVESARILSQTEFDADGGTNLATSPDGKLVSVVSYVRDGKPQGRVKVTFFRTSDLKQIEGGFVPRDIPRLIYEDGAGFDGYISPDGRHLVTQGVHWQGKRAAHMQTTSLNSLVAEPDVDGCWRRYGKTVQIPRSSSVGFVDVRSWPRVVVWNSNIGVLEGADVSAGRIVSRLYLADHQLPPSMTVADLDKAETSLIFQSRGTGRVISDGGHFAYYIPVESGFSRILAGVLKKVDIAHNPPLVVLQGHERLSGLGGVGAAGDHWLYLVKDELGPEGPNGSERLPSRTINVFRTSDLKLQRKIEVSQDQIDALDISRDGKYLYARDLQAGKLAVIEAATGREMNIIDSELLPYPAVVIPLP